MDERGRKCGGMRGGGNEKEEEGKGGQRYGESGVKRGMWGDREEHGKEEP